MIKSFRINPEKERELYEFIQEHGTKKAINKLWEFYQNNKDLDQIIESSIKNALKDVKINAVQGAPKQQEDNNTKQEVSRAGLALFGAAKAK
jgi:hypothetical protein